MNDRSVDQGMTVGLLESVVELDLQRSEIPLHGAFLDLLIFTEIRKRPQ